MLSYTPKFPLETDKVAITFSKKFGGYSQFFGERGRRRGIFLINLLFPSI